jgi:hypothetical protein
MSRLSPGTSLRIVSELICALWHPQAEEEGIIRVGIGKYDGE